MISGAQQNLRKTYLILIYRFKPNIVQFSLLYPINYFIIKTLPADRNRKSRWEVVKHIKIHTTRLKEKKKDKEAEFSSFRWDFVTGVAKRSSSQKIFSCCTIPFFFLKGAVPRFCACVASWFLVWRTFFSRLAFGEKIIFHRPWDARESYHISIFSC